MKKLLIWLVVVLLSLAFGWFIGVNGGGGVVTPPPIHTDTTTVDTVYMYETYYETDLDTLYLTDSLKVDSLLALMGDQYTLFTDSLYKLVDVIAHFDSTTKDFKLQVDYSIPRRTFSVGLDLFVKATTTYVPTYVKEPWYYDFSLIVDSEVSLGFGYSALSVSRNMNTGAYKLTFNPRVSDIMKLINRR